MAHAAPIFVSHAPEDTAWCHTFVRVLREAGADVWYGEHHQSDDLMGQEVDRELQARPLFIAILSPASTASPQVQREVQVAMGLRKQAAPMSSRGLLLVMAEQTDMPRLWADVPCLSGPGDRGLTAPEAAHRALARSLATLAIAPAHIPGASRVSDSSEPARKVTEDRHGPRVQSRVTRGIDTIALLIVAAVRILAILYLWIPQNHSMFQNIANFDPLVGSAPQEITTGPDGALWFTEYYGNAIGRITTGGQLRDFPLPAASGASSSSPEGITAGMVEAHWFTDSGGHQLGWIAGGTRLVPIAGGL